MEEKLASSPLIPPPSEIDLEAGAGAGDQLQCRICLETDGESQSCWVETACGVKGDLTGSLLRVW